MSESIETKLYLVVARSHDGDVLDAFVEATDAQGAMKLWKASDVVATHEGHHDHPRVFGVPRRTGVARVVDWEKPISTGASIRGLVAIAAMVKASERLGQGAQSGSCEATENALVEVLYKGLNEGLISARRAARELDMTLDDVAELCVSHGHPKPFDL